MCSSHETVLSTRQHPARPVSVPTTVLIHRSQIPTCRIFQGCVRYGTYRGIPPVHTASITGNGHFGKFGTTSIPVPDSSVTSVRYGYRYRRYRYRPSYRYRTNRQVRYDINTGTGHFGKLGTASIPVPYTSAISVQHQYRYRTLR